MLDELKQDRDFVAKLEAQCGGVTPISTTYPPEVNGRLLALARDGLRFRMQKAEVQSLDERLAAL